MNDITTIDELTIEKVAVSTYIGEEIDFAKIEIDGKLELITNKTINADNNLVGFIFNKEKIKERGFSKARITISNSEDNWLYCNHNVNHNISNVEINIDDIDDVCYFIVVTNKNTELEIKLEKE